MSDFSPDFIEYHHADSPLLGGSPAPLYGGGLADQGGLPSGYLPEKKIAKKPAPRPVTQPQPAAAQPAPAVTADSADPVVAAPDPMAGVYSKPVPVPVLDSVQAAARERMQNMPQTTRKVNPMSQLGDE